MSTFLGLGSLAMGFYEKVYSKKRKYSCSLGLGPVFILGVVLIYMFSSIYSTDTGCWLRFEQNILSNMGTIKTRNLINNFQHIFSNWLNTKMK